MKVIIENEKFHHNMEGYANKNFAYSELSAMLDKKLLLRNQYERRYKKYN